MFIYFTGYAALPASTNLLQIYKYDKHFPTKNPKNHHITSVTNFNHRYVSYSHIESYLTAMGVVVNTIPVVGQVIPQHKSFNQWLLDTYPEQFKTTKLYAVFRQGTISEGILERRGVSFAWGDFSNVDFSFCTFINCKISNLQSALLIGCEFQNCVSTATALSNADLSFARLLNCTFAGSIGFLRVDYSMMVNCDFQNCSFTSISLEDSQWDETTFQSFHSANTSLGSGGSSVHMDSLLKEVELKHQKQLDDLTAAYASEQYKQTIGK